MSNLISDDNAASELIGYVYTAAISVLILSSMMLTSSTMLTGNISNTAQEEAEEVALYFQLAIEDLLNTVREYPDSSPVVKLEWGMDSINHGIKYKVNGTERTNYDSKSTISNISSFIHRKFKCRNKNL